MNIQDAKNKMDQEKVSHLDMVNVLANYQANFEEKLKVFPTNSNGIKAIKDSAMELLANFVGDVMAEADRRKK